ncbi:type IV secretory system conjugative DNA transfer family protein [Methylomonas sp. SURF-1]|jgi:type IV secretion system protein VirD4|uniref:Type IV secretory system conjugative DNA transfer family protein n=2 Tax=Methylomonas TaxID=416 RepID=A0ABT1TKG1_9GAMM|nr:MULTISPECIES: type IV secretory system conjugative DNA transfer family protein [unclassified Methylomonas]MCQ8105958.1 type IV secretory system conjugative DNA transfer family protein [Methylomonas sp. SURF-2]MCQ8182718.1 type IV secretory system conjugative DNA transfer family protein [Methylomonas sp. SURF-1]
MKKIAKILAGLLLALAAGLYVSGYFFLVVSHLNPYQATPITILQYHQHYGQKPTVHRNLIGSTIAGFLLVGGGIALPLLPRRRALHGDARFASRREIRERGLLDGDGIIIGKLGEKYLSIPGQQGAILAAPPRAGKGVGVVVPNLLNFPGSVIVVDIKKENWEVTAGFRHQHGQEVYLFDPLSEEGQTARWNPFFYVSADPHTRINDIQRIAEMLYTVDGNKDSFWVLSARTLFLGLALYLFETAYTKRTIGEVLRLGMSGGTTGEGFVEHWKGVLARRREGNNPLSWQCVSSIYEVIDLPPQTAGGIRKELTSKLSLWLNPLLDAATSENDMDLRNLRKRPMSIYVGVKPDDLDRIRPVLSLFFQQAIGLQTRELPEHNPQLKHQLLLLLDEFTALGRIPIIETASGFLPGYNVRVLLVIQTPSQLRAVYGRDGADTIMKTLAGRIVFAPKDFPDAQEISNDLGSTTMKGESRSRPMWGTKGQTTTESDQRRMLLLPQEVKEIGPDREIIIYEGIRPILAEKIIYYTDRHFKKRLLPAPKVRRIAPVMQTYENIYTQMDVDDEPTYRPVTIEELENFDELSLNDFAIDTDYILQPTDQPMSADEIKAAAQRYLNLVIED